MPSFQTQSLLCKETTFFLTFGVVLVVRPHSEVQQRTSALLWWRKKTLKLYLNQCRIRSNSCELCKRLQTYKRPLNVFDGLFPRRICDLEKKSLICKNLCPSYMLVVPGEKRGGLYSQVGQDAVQSSRRCRLTALLTARWEIDTARQRELAGRCQGDALLAAQRPGCPPAPGPLPLLCSTAIKPKPAPCTRRHGLEIKYLINYSGVRSLLD